MSETTVYTDFRLHANRLAETGERRPAEVAVRRDLAAAYRLCALFGWDDLVYTHISARVPGPEHHFLVNPLGLGFDEITASSLIKIDLDGNGIGDSGGYEPNAAGFVIHGAIHATRENAGCVMHLHTDAQMALSTLPEGLLPLTQHAMRYIGTNDAQRRSLDHFLALGVDQVVLDLQAADGDILAILDRYAAVLMMT